jgi:pimeloyl-ACP methyl ester carboxylesterase
MAQWAEDWVRGGWMDGVFDGMRVLVFDALGHGRSSKPVEKSAYAIERRAETVISLADEAGLKQFTFFGFSMGGRVGFELAVRSPERLTALVVGGMHGLEPVIDRRNLERRIAVLRSHRWRMVERAVGVRRDDGRNNEQEALALSTEAILDWAGVEAEMPGIKTPNLIYCGESDSILEYAIKSAELVHGSQFVSLPGETHAVSFYSSETARNAVRKFLREIHAQGD